MGPGLFVCFLFARWLALCSFEHMPRRSACIPLPPEFVSVAGRYGIAPDVLALRVLAAFAADPPPVIRVKAAGCSRPLQGGQCQNPPV